jgi:hypothetical protein
MHEYPTTLQGHLESALGSGVYAVAASGNGLADSLVLLKKFVPALQPRSVVLFVEPSDLRDIAWPPTRGHNGFVTDGKKVKIVHNPYQESPTKLVFLRSALLRYLYYNLKLPDLLTRTLRFSSATEGSIHNNSPLEEQQIMDYYMTQLCALQRASELQITFLIDGNRGALYAKGEKAEGLIDLKKRTSFVRMAKVNGFKVVDMQPIFEKHWLTHKERLDYLPADGHWNPVAHKLATDALLQGLNQ